MPHTPTVRGGGSVQQGLSSAGGALGFYRLGLAADKRYSLGRSEGKQQIRLFATTFYPVSLAVTNEPGASATTSASINNRTDTTTKEEFAMTSPNPRAQETREFFQQRLSNLVDTLREIIRRTPSQYVPSELASIAENIKLFPAPNVVQYAPPGKASYFFDFRIGKFSFSNNLLHQWHLFTEDRISDRALKEAMVDHFLLHEMVHIDNDLTSYKYHDTDHAPSVATAVDYDADASAILAALHLSQSERKPRSENLAESWKGPLKIRIQAALLSMELFTDLYAISKPVTVFSEQVFLRYFLWHLQYARAVEWANKTSPLRDFRLRSYPIIDLPDLEENRKASGPWINQSLLERDRLRLFLTLLEDDRPRRIIRFISSDARFGQYVFEGIKDRDPEKSRLGFSELFSSGEGRSLIVSAHHTVTSTAPTDSEWMCPETHFWASTDAKQTLADCGARALSAIDECVVIYRSKDDDFLRPDANAAIVDSSIQHAVLEDPDAATILKVLPKYFPKIDAYLRAAASQVTGEEPRGVKYEAKVGLKGVTIPVEGVQTMVFSADPLSYWFINAFNRKILKASAQDPVHVLRSETLQRFFRYRDNNEWTLDFPSGFYVQVAIITADPMFVLFQKNPSLSVYAATRGGNWTCGIEEGLRWDDHVKDNKLLLQSAVLQGLWRELRLSEREVMSVRFNAVAIELPNLNTAVLGYVRLNLSYTDLKRRIDQSSDFGHLSEPVPVAVVREDIFVNATERKWHPTARMRIHLAVQDLFERGGPSS